MYAFSISSNPPEFNDNEAKSRFEKFWKLTEFWPKNQITNLSKIVFSAILYFLTVFFRNNSASVQQFLLDYQWILVDRLISCMHKSENFHFFTFIVIMWFLKSKIA